MIEFVSKEPITKGWSEDKKYCVKDRNGERFLLRISPHKCFDDKKTEFEMMSDVAELGVPMCVPVEFGTCEEGVYSLQSWVDGVDAMEVIPSFSSEKQYGYGLEAGRQLREIHRIPAPEGIEDWEDFYNRKINKKIERYNACPLKYEKGDLLIDYINSRRKFLKGRPCCFQHGDYHRGNMMVGKDKKLYVIDFNRSDFGDPWEDMKSTTWDVEMSPFFASGKINGYFDNEVPLEFWELFTLYVCVGLLSALPWAIPFGEDEIKVFKQQTDSLIRWCDEMRNSVPSWYIKPIMVNG